MELLDAMTTSTYGMRAQTSRIRVISENIANADTAANLPGEQPYQRKTISFKNILDRETGVNKVVINEVGRDDAQFPTRFMPGHPGANAEGYVQMPNVKTMVEMMDMRAAQRSYEANLNMIKMVRTMTNSTIGLLDQ